MLNEAQKETALELYERAVLGGADQATFHKINLGMQVSERKSSDPVLIAIHEQARAHISQIFDKWLDTVGQNHEEMLKLWLEARAWKLMVSELLNIEYMGKQLDNQLGFDDPDWEGNEND